MTTATILLVGDQARAALTTREFADWFGMSAWVVQEMIRNGELRTLALGKRQNFIPMSEVVRVANLAA